MECSTEGIEEFSYKSEVLPQKKLAAVTLVYCLSFYICQEAKLAKKIVVCHFYAAWSPTCKSAGRIFQKMSIGESCVLHNLTIRRRTSLN